MAKIIFLYGAPASGKTTLGRKLAARLGAAFVDLDAAIVARAGRSIPDIFARDGEPAFRDLESETLAAVVDAAAGDTVVSLGGGTLLRDANRARAEASGTVLCLEAPDAAELARRIGSAAGSRPLGDRARERAPHYGSFPNRVAASFEAADGSLVVVGTGLAPALLAGLPTVADGNVASLYPELVPAPVAVVPSGAVSVTVSPARYVTCFAASSADEKRSAASSVWRLIATASDVTRKSTASSSPSANAAVERVAPAATTHAATKTLCHFMSDLPHRQSSTTCDTRKLRFHPAPLPV